MMILVNLYLFFRKMTDEFYSFAFMIETPLHRIKNITTEISTDLIARRIDIHRGW